MRRIAETDFVGDGGDAEAGLQSGQGVMQTQSTQMLVRTFQGEAAVQPAQVARLDAAHGGNGGLRAQLQEALLDDVTTAPVGDQGARIAIIGR